MSYTPAGAMGADLASGTTITLTHQIHRVSGVGAIATITVPDKIKNEHGFIILIPTGIFTMTTVGGNIGLAVTAVVSRALILVWDVTAGKWIPSYV